MADLPTFLVDFAEAVRGAIRHALRTDLQITYAMTLSAAPRKRYLVVEMQGIEDHRSARMQKKLVARGPP